MRPPRLINEIATIQERALTALELNHEYDDEDDGDEPMWGSDPFVLLARIEEEQGCPLASS